LDESIRYGGRNIKRGDIIQFECHKIANQFVGVKGQDLMGSNFYVNNDFAKDSMEMLSECRFHNSINGF